LNKNMKVTIATGIFTPDIGGPATYVERLAIELEKRGMNGKVITYANTDSRTVLAWQGQSLRGYNFPITRIFRGYTLPLRYFLYFWRLLFLARSADVIYAQCPVGSGLPSLLVSKVLGKKFVLKITGDYAWEQGRARFGLTDSLDEFQEKKYSWPVELFRQIEKWVAQGANKIITPSQYLKKIVQKWGIAEEKIKVIYNAIEKMPEPEISQEQAKKKLGLQGDILLSIGRLVPWKGFDSLIGLMPDLLKENPHFKLVIIGQGPEKKNLEFRIWNLELRDKVFLLDQMPHSKLLLYFKTADCFILNTGYEGLPHIILEAMQMKAPVITTNVGGNPEVIKDGYNGLLVEYNNRKQLKEAILKLWLDKKCQQKFITNSLKELKKFNLDEMINQTLEVLKR